MQILQNIRVTCDLNGNKIDSLNLKEKYIFS